MVINRHVTNLQDDCQNLLSTGLLRVFLTSCNTSAKTSCNKPDFNRLDEIDKFVAT